jgi:hypothetical protein
MDIKIVLLATGLVLVIATATFATSVQPVYAPRFQTITTLNISGWGPVGGLVHLIGAVTYGMPSHPVGYAIVSFTGTGVKTGSHETTGRGGGYDLIYPQPSPGTDTVQAHFTGKGDFDPSDSQIKTFTVS